MTTKTKAPKSDRLWQVRLALTTAERDRLRIMAATAGVSMSAFVYEIVAKVISKDNK